MSCPGMHILGLLKFTQPYVIELANADYSHILPLKTSEIVRIQKEFIVFLFHQVQQ